MKRIFILSILFTILTIGIQAQTDINALDANGHTQLTAAVTLGDRTKVSELLGQGAAPDLANANGDIPVTIAAKAKRNDIINLLIGGKANMNATDKEGYIGLYYAVQQNDVQSAQAMLVAGANPNAKGVVDAAVASKSSPMMLALSTYKADFTPGLARAAQMNDVPLFKSLINFGARCTDNTPLERALDNNNSEIVLLSLDNGANAAKGLDYCIAKDKRPFLTFMVSKGADANKATSYAVKKSETMIVTELMQRYAVKADFVLQEAMMNNVLPVAELALQQGADPNPYVENAVTTKDLVKTEMLLKNRGDANKALKAAVNSESLEMCQLSLKYGATTADSSLLSTAVRKNHFKISELLTQSGARVTNPRMMIYPVQKSNVELTQLLLANGGSAMDPKLLEASINNSNVPITEMLLNGGANAGDGLKPAIQKNNEQILRMLLTRGAQATEPELMNLAATGGNLQIVNTLMEFGADPNNGMKSAINHGKDQIVDALLAKGAHVNDPEYMAGAVSKGNIKLTNTLLGKGAPVSYNSGQNENLLHLACRVESYNIAKTLLDKGSIDVNQKNSSGETPLHVAVNSSKNDIELCQLLLDKGADIKARTSSGKTVYQLARGAKLKKYLKSKGAPKK
jgi:ankyrin repeat protein